MKPNRRAFLQTIGVTGSAGLLLGQANALWQTELPETARHLHFVQMDVFTSRRLEGNQLAVFTDARGLSDSDMQNLARETNLPETTFVFPREAALERQEGVKVRIFTSEEELPFAGHPTLGTSTVIRKLRRSGSPDDQAAEIVLDLKAGKVPVSFREDASGTFGEMRQIAPLFGPVHDRNAIAALLGLNAADIEAALPIQTVSTGLPFVIVPITQLSTLQRLRVPTERAYEYLKSQPGNANDFYFITRDTGDAKTGLRARLLSPSGEDPATGSAAGCTSAWMVMHGVFKSDETVLVRQGVEMKRPSELYVRSSKTGDTVSNVRVGGHAVQVSEGEVSL